MIKKKETGFDRFTPRSVLFFVFILLISSCGQRPSALPQHESRIQVTQEMPNDPPKAETKAADTLAMHSVEYLMGKFDPAKHDLFIKIEKQFTTKDQIYMRREAYDAFRKMHDAAGKEGIPLKIISATRNFQYQKGIWEKKWLREKYHGWSDVEKVRDILKYSSMPGTSRHHWGTDVDFNSVELSYYESGIGKKVYAWLTENAAEYGYAQTYTSKSGGRTGYEEEKWHWSYMPLSGELLKSYNNTVKYSDIQGFSGSAAAEASDVFRLYVNGIEASLLK